MVIPIDICSVPIEFVPVVIPVTPSVIHLKRVWGKESKGGRHEGKEGGLTIAHWLGRKRVEKY